MCRSTLAGWALLSLLLAGCESAADIPGGRYNRSFVFSRETDQVTDAALPATGSRTIHINGTFEAPNSCYRLDSQIDDEGRNLVVTITGQPGSGACAEGSGYFRYTMVNGFFFPGTWHLRIVHMDDARGPRTLFDANVAVQF